VGNDVKLWVVTVWQVEHPQQVVRTIAAFRELRKPPTTGSGDCILQYLLYEASSSLVVPTHGS
jgi:hypothetical protein